MPAGERDETHLGDPFAMAAAVFALRHDGVVIQDPSCVNKTFPDFFDRWERLLA